MAFYQIAKFTGVDINVESGEGVTSPTEVKSFVFDRQGGLTAKYGATSTGATAYTGMGSLGYSPDGLSAKISGTAAKLYDGTSLHSGTVASGTFVPTLGVVRGSAILIKDASGNVRTATSTIINVSATTTTSTSSISTFQSGSYLFYVTAETPTKQGRYLVGKEGRTISMSDKKTATISISGGTASTLAAVYYGKKDTAGNVSSATLAGFIQGATGSITISSSAGTTAFSPTLAWGGPLWATSPRATPHWQRVWGTLADTQAYGNGYFSMAPYLNAGTLVYTEIGMPNTVLVDNWLTVPFQASTKVTALASTPAGLLIFGDKETYLMQGDPANASSFDLKLISAEIGHDSGAEQPAVIGGGVFPVYNGRIYEIALGMGDVDFGTGMSEVGYPVWNAADGFVQAVGEPRWNQLVARTSGGKIYRYDLHTKSWFTDVLTGTSVTRLLPNPDGHGTRYLLSSNSHIDTVESGTAATPDVKFEDVDMGDRGLKKMWRRVRIFASDSYTGTPTLTYNVSGSSGTISGDGKGGGRFIFTLPNGLVGERADLTVNMAGAATHDSLKAPVVIEFTPRYRQR